MGRLLKAVILAFLVLIPLAAATGRAQIERVLPPNPEQTNDPFDPFGPFGRAERTAETTAEVTILTPTPAAPPQTFVWLDVRKDLELMASDRLGGSTRPQGWSGPPADWLNPDIPLLTRLDLELLATTLINSDQRPDGWIGAVASVPIYIARDGRHDIELLADLMYGDNVRPLGWTGGDPLWRCSRATQTLINLLERGGVFRLQLDANDPDFCRKAELEVTVYTEQQILGNAQISNLFTDELIVLSPNSITTDLAIAWLDATATRRVGVIPRGTPIRIIGRSYASFSRMLLVSGDNFEVFVEYPNTTVDAGAFRRLPNYESLTNAPYCFAEWCERTSP